MSADILPRYAIGGATRPDSFSGMQPAFSGALAAMFAAAPPEIQAALRVKSGYRSNERQRQLWEAALAKYGSAQAARRMVAPPGRSQHNHGNAADLDYGNDAARAWAHQNAARFGLAFPMSWENWHVELAGARGKPGGPASAATVSPAGQSAGTAPVAPPGGLAATMVAPAPPSQLDLGAALLQALQPAPPDQRQAAEQEAAAEQARRAALFGNLGAFFG